MTNCGSARCVRRAPLPLGVGPGSRVGTAGTAPQADQCPSKLLGWDRLSSVDRCDARIWRNGRVANGHSGAGTRKLSAGRAGERGEHRRVRRNESDTDAAYPVVPLSMYEANLLAPVDLPDQARHAVERPRLRMQLAPSPSPRIWFTRVPFAGDAQAVPQRRELGCAPRSTVARACGTSSGSPVQARCIEAAIRRSARRAAAGRRSRHARGRGARALAWTASSLASTSAVRSPLFVSTPTTSRRVAT